MRRASIEKCCADASGGDATTLDSLARWLLNDHNKARQDLERARQVDPSLPI